METFSAEFWYAPSFSIFSFIVLTAVPIVLSISWVSYGARHSIYRNTWLSWTAVLSGFLFFILVSVFLVLSNPIHSIEDSEEIAPRMGADVSDAAVERFGEDVKDQIIRDGNKNGLFPTDYDPESQEYTSRILLDDGDEIGVYEVTVELDGTTTFEKFDADK